MHTWHHGRTIFNGNSDFSGDLFVTDSVTHNTMSVPGADILSLAARFVRNSRIAEAEQKDGDHESEIRELETMDDRTLLGVSEEAWHFADGAPSGHGDTPA